MNWDIRKNTTKQTKNVINVNIVISLLYIVILHSYNLSVLTNIASWTILIRGLDQCLQ